MNLRICLGLVLSAAGTLLPAQGEQGQKPADPNAAGAKAGDQDPDRAQKSPAERIGELTSEKERLEREIAFVKDRVAKCKDLLAGKFRDRALSVRSIDAGTSVATPVAYAPAQRQARLMTDDERRKVAADTLMTVNGREVGKAGLENMMAYLRTFQSSGDDSYRTQKAMLEIIRIESTHASFPEGAAEAQQKITEAQQELAAGKPFGEVAQKYSRGPLQEDGKIRLTRNCAFGLPVEMAAFATAEGKVTAPVRGYTGWVLLQVDKLVKGANQDNTPNTDLDSVEAHMILIPFHPDPAELDAARNRAVMGPIDILARDDAVMQQLPPLYRPLPAQKENLDADIPKAVEPAKGDAGRKG
jgi:hypothetical protein